MRPSNRPPLDYDVRYDVMNDSAWTLSDAHRLLAEFCHDVRQPLTTIRMNLQVVARLLNSTRESADIGAALEAVADCLDAEQELDALFAGASRLIRASSSSAARTDLNSVALDAVRLYRASTRSNSIKLRLAEPSPVVNGEARRLRYALRSLLRHGLALDGDGPSAELLVVGTRQTSSYAELSVSGLPLSLVFGPTQSRPLAVTTLVARAYGGIARIESCDAAATVRIVLPGAAQS